MRKTEEKAFKAFKRGVEPRGLRGFLMKEKPADIAEAFQVISEYEAIARASQLFGSPRLDTSSDNEYVV